MRVEIEVEEDELIIHVPRQMIIDKAKERDKATEPANIHNIITNVMQGLEDAIKNREEQASNQRQHSNRDACREASKTGCCNSNEQSRQEQKEVTGLGPVTTHYLNSVPEYHTRTLLRSLLTHAQQLAGRVRDIEMLIEETYD